MSWQDYRIGIICALSVELTAVRAMLVEVHEDLVQKPDDGNCYSLGRIGKHNVVIACLPSGQYGVASAVNVANRLLHTFPSIKHGLMVGIAGGIPSSQYDLRLGDVVVSKPSGKFGGVVQYDFGKTIPPQTEHGRTAGESAFLVTAPVHYPSESLLTAISKLQSIHNLQGSSIGAHLAEATNRYPKYRGNFQRPQLETDILYKPQYEHKDIFEDSSEGSESVSSLCRSCDPEFRVENRQSRKSEEPVIHYGLIASGNQLMRHASTRDKIGHETGALCFEMEAAGVMSKNFLIIRGVCDYADSHKNKIWQPYAAATAAAYARELIEVIPADEDPKLSPESETEPIQISRKCAKECQKHLYFQELEFRYIDIKPAARDTCSWIFTHLDFVKWLNSQRPLLWIKGKPGAGKSTLMKYLLDHMDPILRQNSERNIVLSFFFHGRGSELQRTRSGAFRSILYQIIDRSPSSAYVLLRKFLEKMEKAESSKTDWHWTVEELLHYLKRAVGALLKVFHVTILVDALDECGEDEAVELIKNFRQLISDVPHTSTRLLVCFSCRHYPIVDVCLDTSISVEEETLQDIETYTKQQVQSIGISGDDLNVLLKRIVDKASGVFQWIGLVIQKISKLRRTGRPLKALMSEVDRLPPDLGSLYRDLLGGLEEDEKPQALKLMQWCAFSIEPLISRQMRLALIIDENSHYQSYKGLLDDDQIGDIKSWITSASVGLLEVKQLEYGDIVQFIHQSAKDFFIDDGFRMLGHWAESKANFAGVSHRRLAGSCIQYFSLLVYLGGREKELIEDGYGSFLQYAAYNWLHHVDAVCRHGVPYNELVEQFAWPSPEIYGNWPKLHLTSSGWPGTLLHLAAARGWVDPLQVMLESLSAGRNEIGDPKDSPHARTPLSYAAEAGCYEIAKILLARADVDVDSKDRHSRTPLWYAAKSGKATLVRLLLSRKETNINHEDKDGKTPIFCAAEYGLDAVVNLLLAHEELDISRTDRDCRTPLWHAVSVPNVTTTRLLLASGKFDVNYKDRHGESPLAVAAKFQRPEMIQLLIENDADLETMDNQNRTPLVTAALNGSRDATKLLLSRGANPNHTNTSGQTLLMLLVMLPDSRPQMQLLLDSGADINRADADGMTTLMIAAGSNKTMDNKIIKFLLDQGADIHQEDKQGDTALTYAFRNMFPDVIKLLLEYGADINHEDKQGRTMLSYAAETTWSTRLIKLLLDHGADIHHEDKHGGTALTLAAKSKSISNWQIIKILLDLGADIHHKDEQGRTALTYAAQNCLSKSLIELLLDHGADIHHEDELGRTALSYAGKGPFGGECLMILMRRGASINQKDKSGRLPLSYAEVDVSNLLTLAHDYSDYDQERKASTS